MPPDRELERELRELGSRVEYPPTPDLARAVRRRLDREGTGRPARSRTIWPSLPPSGWAVAAAAIVLVVATPLLSPTMRDAVNGWFAAEGAARSGDSAGGSASLESREDAAGAPSAPRSESGQGGRFLGKGLGLGERVTLGEARSRTDAPVLLPRAAGTGEPETYAGDPREDGVTLVYRARPGLPPLGTTEVGLILTERIGGVETAYFPEERRPEEGFERVEVGDGLGYWAPAGSDASRSGLLGGSVLLWEHGDRALRLESDLPEDKAIRVAESVR
jgi:hypothetical protein